MANPPTPDQQWILSATAILTNLTRRQPRHDCLGGAPKDAPDAEQTAKAILKNSWGIETREKLEQTIEWLGSSGHTAEYQKIAAALSTATPQQQADPKMAFAAQYGAQLGTRGLMAWDVARLFAIAGWGYLAGLCNDAEAWGVSMPQAQRLRSGYASWDEFGDHYRLGCLFWSADAVGQTDSILTQLRSAPDSPWKATPWALGSAGAPITGAPSPGAQGPAAAPYAPAPGAAPYGAPGAQSPYGAPGGAVPGADAYAQANPGIYGSPQTGGAPYGAPPGAMAPAGGVPGGAPVMAPSGGAAGPAKKKTGLLIGIIAGGVVVLGLLFAVVWHFTHENEPRHEPAHEHEHPKGKR